MTQAKAHVVAEISLVCKKRDWLANGIGAAHWHQTTSSSKQDVEGGVGFGTGVILRDSTTKCKSVEPGIRQHCNQDKSAYHGLTTVTAAYGHRDMHCNV